MTKKTGNSSDFGPEIQALKNAVFNIFAANPQKAFNPKQLASRLGLKPKEVYLDMMDALELLTNDGSVVEVDQMRYKLKHIATFAEGVVDMTTSGNAYVVCPEVEDDVLVTAGNLKHALHGDRVRLMLYARKKNKRPEGEVVEVLQRARTEFVGVINVTPHAAYLVPDNKRMPVDVFVPADKIGGANDGDKVVVRMIDWPERSSAPFGEVIKVIGRPGDHNVEIHAILAEYGLPYAFPEEVESEASLIALELDEAEIARRRDFRGVTTFTIDPVDAKDFDDALSIQKLKNGLWEIGVHIADVSHYVKPGTKLDEEASERATSVYLVDRVVPMLPEVLSNLVCSLRPDEDKFTFSAVFQMDDEGNIKDQWFGRTVIRSIRRFTYEEAQERIEGKPGDFYDEIHQLDKLAKLLRNARMKHGAISFDKAEVRFSIDEEGNPLGVFYKISKDSNHLIEEFMLLANRKVAEYVGKGKDGGGSGKTFVYRIHDDPDPAKLLDLSNFIKQFGYSVDLNGRKSISRSLNQLLEQVKGKPEANMIETITVRSMAKAIYSTKNIGHYGLAFDYYTHFTSPIRRYPDVMAHRLLQHYLDGKSSPTSHAYEEECVHDSERERMAAEAERASIKYMQVKYMEQFVGQEFDGRISGVTDWGIFVELDENHCEGMIRLRDMRDDYYVFDEKNYAIIGERTGRSYRLGDSMRIRVKKADLERKIIDFEPADYRSAPVNSRPRPIPKSVRKPKRGAPKPTGRGGGGKKRKR